MISNKGKSKRFKGLSKISPCDLEVENWRLIFFQENSSNEIVRQKFWERGRYWDAINVPFREYKYYVRKEIDS